MTGQHVVVDASAARSSDALAQTLELIRTLPRVAPRHRFTVFVGPAVRRQLDRTTAPNLSVRPVQLPSLASRLAWQQSVLPVAASSLGADWVLSPFNLVALAPALSRSCSTAVVVSAIAPFAPQRWLGQHGYEAVRDAVLRALTLASIRRADLFAVVGETAYSLIEPDVAGTGASILTPAPPTTEALERALSVATPHPRDRPYFACIGDLYRHAGVEDAILAIAAVNRRGFAADLVVCGRFVERRYAARLQRLASKQAGGLVRFVPAPTQTMELTLMRHARATIVCSRLGDSTRIPLAGMAVGSPVVAADTPLTVEACGDGAAYYAPTEHADLSATMEDLLWREHERAYLRQRGTRRISELDAESVARGLVSAMGLN